MIDTVYDLKEEAAPEDKFFVILGDDNIKSIKESGYSFLNPRYLNETFYKEKLEKKFLLTVDDGYASFYEFAWPYLKENKIPFLGICFGMQMAIIEFARNKLNIKKAGSSELDKKCYPVIGLINEWDKNGKIIKGTDKDLGGTMRLGLYEAKLRNNSAINRIYKSKSIKERHRHRYEVNNNLKDEFERKGLIFSGMSPDNKLPEIIELKNHPWFIGVQFHPEFKSRPLAPHPLFSSFIKAAKNHK